MEIHALDKEQIILQFRANPNDSAIFELLYCSACREVVPVGGLFAPLAEQKEHDGHPVAWLPAQDSSLLTLPSGGHIVYWLEASRPWLDPVRYAELTAYADTTNSGNWVWVLNETEQADWLLYLANYLERLADGWLAALNAQPSNFFPIPARVWYQPGRMGLENKSELDVNFRWQTEQPISNLINPTFSLSRSM